MRRQILSPLLPNHVHTRRETGVVDGERNGQHRANPQLMRLKIPEKVGRNYRKFGTLLLNDDIGSLVDIAEKSCHYQPDDIVTSILRKWLQERDLLQ